MEAETKKRLLEILKNTGITLLVFALCTGLCYFLDYFKINDLNFLIIYVLGILLTAVFTKGFAYSSFLWSAFSAITFSLPFPGSPSISTIKCIW